MKIVVTGVGGQLGTDVVEELTKRGHDVIGLRHADLDLTCEENVKSSIMQIRPEAIIHCAAYTAVDAAEENEALAFDVNVNATRYLVDCCKALSAKLLYISTDYVFSGTGEKPWEVDDLVSPCNVYGKTKYEGERIVQQLEQFFIVRTSWVVGVTGKNFVKTMLNLGKTRDEITVVADQYGAPTFTADLAVLLADMIVSTQYGIYHASNEGVCSWYEFASKIFEYTNNKVNVKPVESKDYPAKAIRPKNSRLSKDSLVQHGFLKLPNWETSLYNYLKKLEEV